MEHCALMLAPGTYTLDVGGTLVDVHGTAVATVDLPPTGAPRVDFPDGTGRPFVVDPYGKGWQLCARNPDDVEDVLLWYRPRAIRSGGTVELADGTEYEVRSSPLKRLDLSLREDGRSVLEVTGHPHDGWADIVVEVRAAPARAEHGLLLTAFLAVLGALVYREGRAQRGFGFDGPA